MGRTRKRHNWRARQLTHSSVEKCQTNDPNVLIDFHFDQHKYDASNPLVIVPAKPNVKSSKSSELSMKKSISKPLSAKKKKKLEKILEKKRKKSDRSKLLEELQKYQTNQDMYSLLSSTCNTQTKGRKRKFENNQLKVSPSDDSTQINVKYKNKKKRKIIDPNKVEVENDSLSESDDESDNQSDYDTHNINESKTLDTVESETMKIIENKTEVSQKKTDESNDKPLKTECETLKKESLSSVNNELTKIQTIFVNVNRTPEIEKVRSLLPILTEEQMIMEAVRYNSFVLLCGETGSGKTTQMPQFLYEAGFATNGQMIGVTEPRRVAAIAMSQRVANEMNLSHDEVSYQIRFDGNVTENTKIKFMTDGVLLKHIQNDFLLSNYSVIIIDEAHERSVFSDILIGLLSRIVPLRLKRGNPLKCIIMSATLRVDDFTLNQRLFKTIPPVLKIESRQFPVTVHFSKRTPDDYIDEAYKKVCKIHTSSHSGGILVFVTGQKEVNLLCKKLRLKFSNKRINNKKLIKNTVKSQCVNPQSDLKQNEEREKDNSKKTINDILPSVNLNDYPINTIDELELLEKDVEFNEDSNDGDDSSSSDDETIQTYNFSNVEPLYCLPLYSIMPKHRQELIFKDPPNGSRLCIIATNVAETSLTIPNIRYVVDTGKVKTKLYDKVTGISTFVITWTSKASADQRAGRAGRTAPGHCYRLYSSSVFNDNFAQYSEPEIIRKPVDDLLLQMKSMNIENVVNFPFPSQPDRQALAAAEKRLIQIGALEDIPASLRLKQKSKLQYQSKITPLGKAMSCFPICPRYAKMLVLSHQHNLYSYIIAIVSALTVQELFTDNYCESNESDDSKEMIEKKRIDREKWLLKRQRWSGNGHSQLLGDIMVLLNAIGASDFVGCTPMFCEKNGIRYKAIIQIHKLRKQLTAGVNEVLKDSNIVVTAEMTAPDQTQAKLMRQIVLCGFFDHIARKIPDSEISDEKKRAMKNAYMSIEVEDPVFISNDSILKNETPEFVIYQEIYETSKLFMRVVSAIEPEWLPIYVPSMCTFTNPLEDPPPRYDPITDTIKCHRASTFGPHSWNIQPVEVEYPQGIERYKLFAKFLIDGQIIEFFKEYSKVLLSPSSIIVKSWAALQPRTEKLLRTLINDNIDTKESLIQKWHNNSEYMLNAYLDWIPQMYHPKITSQWPPII